MQSTRSDGTFRPHHYQQYPYGQNTHNHRVPVPEPKLSMEALGAIPVPLIRGGAVLLDGGAGGEAARRGGEDGWMASCPAAGIVEGTQHVALRYGRTAFCLKDASPESWEKNEADGAMRSLPSVARSLGAFAAPLYSPNPLAYPPLHDLYLLSQGAYCCQFSPGGGKHTARTHHPHQITGNTRNQSEPSDPPLPSDNIPYCLPTCPVPAQTVPSWCSSTAWDSGALCGRAWRTPCWVRPEPGAARDKNRFAVIIIDSKIIPLLSSALVAPPLIPLVVSDAQPRGAARRC